MRLVMAAMSLALFAGCLSESPGADGHHTEPWVVADRDFGSGGVANTNQFEIALEEGASRLQVRLDFGSSAFTGFHFTAPDACRDATGGPGLYSRSGATIVQCGPVAAGRHVVAWQVDTGYAQGHITITASPT